MVNTVLEYFLQTIQLQIIMTWKDLHHLNTIFNFKITTHATDANL